jgi:hypothetical protein
MVHYTAAQAKAHFFHLIDQVEAGEVVEITTRRGICCRAWSGSAPPCPTRKFPL